MTEQLNTQDLVQSLKQFVENYSNDNVSKSKKIILELSPAIKDAAKKGISKKQVFEHLKSKGFKMSYSTFSKWLDKLNLYTSKTIRRQKSSKSINKNIDSHTQQVSN